MGNFIEVSSRSSAAAGGPATRIVRIDGIFIHELFGTKRLFTKVTEVEDTGVRDRILDLPLLRLANSANDDMIVGLPSIKSKRIYIIPVTVSLGGITGLGKANAKDFVMVDWPVKFL
jgi:hypothetical protein